MKGKWLFSPNCVSWSECDGYNMMYLDSLQKIANEKLMRSRKGVLTVAEIFSELVCAWEDIPKDFFIQGWKLPQNHYEKTKEPYITYIKWDIMPITMYWESEGPITCYLVDFNTDGVVFSLED